jgi:hypothetical protein
MGIAYRVDPSTGMSLSVWYGDVTLQEAMQHVRELWATPEWGSGGRILTDLAGVSSSSLPNPDQISEIAAVFVNLIDGRMRQARWAVVANLGYSHASQFAEAIQTEVRRVVVFFDLASACIWLGVDLDAVRPVVEPLRIEVQSREHEKHD